jgi:hypothetical protein
MSFAPSHGSVFSPAALATFSDSGRKIRKGQEALVLLATQPSSDPVLGKMEREPSALIWMSLKTIRVECTLNESAS